MRRRSIIGFGLAAVVAAGSLGACSTTYSKSDLKSELVNQGMSDSLATCVSDGMEAKGLLKDPDTYSAEETAALGQVTTDCTLKEAGLGGGITIPSISVPDVSIPDVSIPDVSIPDVSIPQN